MGQVDRWVGIALAVLAGAVLWTASAFPDVPGQDIGAGFLPLLVGAGLLACGLGLVLRSLRARSGARAADPAAPADEAAAEPERYGGAAAIVGAIVLYIALADRLGFLLVAPVCLMLTFKALRVRTRTALVGSLIVTLVVHLAFYKLLRVPLPWGVLRPLY